MSVTSEMLGVCVPHEFTHRGKTYQVRLIDQGVKAAYEKKLFARAKEAALGMRDLMDAKEYSEHLRQLNSDYIAGKFQFEGEVGSKFVETAAGATTLLSLVMDCSEAELISMVAERKDELVSLLELVVSESFPHVEQAEKKVKAPRLKPV